MKNLIAFQRGLVIFPAPAGSESGMAGTAVAASLQAELMNLGFVLDPAALAAAEQAPRDWLIAWHGEIIPHLRTQLGAARAHRPMYRNFPRQVMEMTHLRLFLNALAHYWSDGTWEPPQELAARGVAFERTDFNPLRPGTEDDLLRVFSRLVSANQSLTHVDRQALTWFAETYRDRLPLPASIPFKETLCLLAAAGLDVPVQTPTDVLRIAVHLSGGDISLPGVPPLKVEDPYAGRYGWWIEQMRQARAAEREKFKFRKFKRGERRRLLAMLENTGADPAEMQRHLGRWLRLGEVLHPGEHADRFPRAAEAFHRLRNQHDRASRVRTFAGRVDLAFAQDWRAGVALLATRPGEFARRLDWMLRTLDGERREALETFERIGPSVSAKVLVELFNHFRARMDPHAARAVMLKGRGAKMKTLDPLPPMDRDRVQQVGNSILRVIRARVATLPPLGRVWIDPRLARLPVPFAMRSVNAAVRTYVRGTRIPFRADAKVIRPFIHWLDEQGDQDLDLSAGLYDATLKPIAHISFTNLKDERLNCCHSGDIVARRGACAEYIDIDVQRCLDAGVRYGVIQAFNYRARPLHTVKECVFGLMEREHAVANEIFVPRTIANCMPLANQGNSLVVCAVDLVERDYVWADVESERTLPMLENTRSRTIEVIRALLQGTNLSVHELLTIHAQTRGSLVAEASQAEHAFRWNDFVTDYSASVPYTNF